MDVRHFFAGIAGVNSDNQRKKTPDVIALDDSDVDDEVQEQSDMDDEVQEQSDMEMAIKLSLQQQEYRPEATKEVEEGHEKEQEKEQAEAEEENECVICLDIISSSNCDQTAVLDCGHAFHSACIQQWAKTANTCPLCQKRFTKIEVGPGDKTTCKHNNADKGKTVTDAKQTIAVKHTERRNSYIFDGANAASRGNSNASNLIDLFGSDSDSEVSEVTDESEYIKSRKQLARKKFLHGTF
jgi:hypothetical protein